MSQAQRIRSYNQAVAKLNVKPDIGLDTPYGHLPIELMELIAVHLHPEDVARLRSVSSGWRAALWQERVVRASLRGIGPRVNELLLFKIVCASDRHHRFMIHSLLIERDAPLLPAHWAALRVGILFQPLFDAVQMKRVLANAPHCRA